ncbi:hypothetical protein JOL79_04680 [Microbispora sp. RL4-1S]|uniref:Uncharacterized protein n=1 Tax=Microbispora oryzae TaxID=2806554 RepID=A0A940WCU1_9ACTN|nr:hypothetical protein [Microbispora oryzae]MBP2703096.1 hypothetical protein [Microbispora oryzae]
MASIVACGTAAAVRLLVLTLAMTAIYSGAIQAVPGERSTGDGAGTGTTASSTGTGPAGEPASGTARLAVRMSTTGAFADSALLPGTTRAAGARTHRFSGPNLSGPNLSGPSLSN